MTSRSPNSPHMILCVAGQSNAVGYDESPIPAGYERQFHTERIRQLGLYGADNLRPIPLGACAQNYQDMRPFSNPQNKAPNLGTKGMHLPLADLLLPYLPPEASLLVVPCAYGGTAFTVGEKGSYNAAELRPEPGIWRWGVDSPYYLAMRSRISFALRLHPENQFLGVVWLQGESDNADAAGQKAGFERMTQDFFDYFSDHFPSRVYRGDWNKDIWYNVETVSHWYSQGQCSQIWANYRAWNPATYVEIPRDTDSNEKNGTGLTSSTRACHFGNDAYLKVVAPRVAAAIGARLTARPNSL